MIKKKFQSIQRYYSTLMITKKREEEKMVLENLNPQYVWSIFENLLASTPRESKHEELIHEKIVDWVKTQSKLMKIETEIFEDEIGNILIKIPAVASNKDIDYENIPSLMFQAHMDMVCETNRHGGFNFTSEKIPLKIQENNEWVDADGTTLGADDGIGVALILGLFFNPDERINHGPIEILFTVDEETGLTGAFGLDLNKLPMKSKFLINVDSEDFGIITIGAAGGGDSLLTKHFERIIIEEPREYNFYSLSVSGLSGGHSGVDIHENRANANKLISRFLTGISQSIEVCLGYWNGGSKHNAITRESEVSFAIKSTQTNALIEIQERIKQEISSYFNGVVKFESKICINLKSIDPIPIINASDSKAIISSINLIPHGVIKYSPVVAHLVETSNNLAVIDTTQNSLTVHVSSRSNIDSELANFRSIYDDIAEGFGWELNKIEAYPGWTPEPNSEFLAFVSKIYKKSSGSDIKIEAIHAGLETGIIGAKIPGIQMVSIGPTIKNPHTPAEKVNITSVGDIYNVIKEIIMEFHLYRSIKEV